MHGSDVAERNKKKAAELSFSGAQTTGSLPQIQVQSAFCAPSRPFLLLHIFGIRRFDNMNYLKVYKRISVRKICIEIDQLPMESATSRTTSFPPPSPHIFARYSSQN